MPVCSSCKSISQHAHLVEADAPCSWQLSLCSTQRHGFQYQLPACNCLVRHPHWTHHTTHRTARLISHESLPNKLSIVSYTAPVWHSHNADSYSSSTLSEWCAHLLAQSLSVQCPALLVRHECLPAAPQHTRQPRAHTAMGTLLFAHCIWARAICTLLWVHCCICPSCYIWAHCYGHTAAYGTWDAHRRTGIHSYRRSSRIRRKFGNAAAIVKYNSRMHVCCYANLQTCILEIERILQMMPRDPFMQCVHCLLVCWLLV